MAGIALAAAFLTGCGGGSVGRVPASGPIPVVAAENFWGSLARSLGGTEVAVKSIVVNPDSDPHDYEPTAADARAIASAGYVIYNGLGYDTWFRSTVATGGVRGRRVLDVGAFLGLRAGDNPHRWYFPADVHRVVDEMTADLIRLRPVDEAYFRSQYVRVEQALAPYDTLVAQLRRTYAGTAIGASESIAEGFASAARLDLVTPASFLDATSEGVEPTPRDRATVNAQIHDREIAVFVYNSQNSSPDVTSLVRAARAEHIPVVAVTETMPADSTFVAWQIGELGQLARALAAAA